MRGAVVLLLLALTGCTKNPEEPVTPPEPSSELHFSTPLPRVDRPWRRPPDIIAPPPATPGPLLRSEAPKLSENVADLDARFHSRTTTAEQRDEIIQTLGRLEAPQALPFLRRIFEEEKRLDLRMRVLEVTGDLPTDAAAPGRWELFARATEARQPVVMRLSAMQTLADSEDPRAGPLLQQLARDPNASIRENAARILKERQP